MTLLPIRPVEPMMSTRGFFPFCCGLTWWLSPLSFGPVFLTSPPLRCFVGANGDSYIVIERSYQGIGQHFTDGDSRASTHFSWKVSHDSRS
jgi:hypothetical protein